MPGSAVFFLQNAFLCHEFVLICHNKKTYFCIISKVCFGFFLFVIYVINVIPRALYFKENAPFHPPEIKRDIVA